ncbi:MAG: cytochrome-c peroxidase [Bacteroidetes bacterium]|nr:cytochrome-c peroxidase [Bacteroidota bacterium]
MIITIAFFFLISGFSLVERLGVNGGDVPIGFPAVLHPEDNQPTYKRWALGKKLFFDPIMSDDGMISCASCHAPEKAFSDDVSLSLGVRGFVGTQNAPSLTNVAYNPYFTRAGGVPTLEMQILVPIQEHNEFGSNIIEIAERMSIDSSYVQMSREAYDREPDAFVITRALACFERSLISGNSRYDQYEFQGKKSALNSIEIKGKELFFSERSQCSSCHSGFNFTDYSFQNNGLYEQYADSGRFRFTGVEADRDLFKVPSLRNIGFTAPYMHDGSIETLEEVIEHYSEGLSEHRHRAAQLKPFHFNKTEKKSLLAFLKTLDDHSFISDERFHNN